MELSTLLHVYIRERLSRRTFWCPIRNYEFCSRCTGRPGTVNLTTRIEKYRIDLDTAEFAQLQSWALWASAFSVKESYWFPQLTKIIKMKKKSSTFRNYILTGFYTITTH